MFIPQFKKYFIAEKCWLLSEPTASRNCFASRGSYLLFVKTVSVRWNKLEHNKMRYVCIDIYLSLFPCLPDLCQIFLWVIGIPGYLRGKNWGWGEEWERDFYCISSKHFEFWTLSIYGVIYSKINKSNFL